MQNVLADLALESEAATALTMRLARAFDDERRRARGALARIATAIGKFWICKRGPHARVRGDGVPRRQRLRRRGQHRRAHLPRDAAQLDLGRLRQHRSRSTCCARLGARRRRSTPFLAEVKLAAGANAQLDAHVEALTRAIATETDYEPRARRLVEDVAVALQASLLVRHAPSYVADAFCASRLGDERGREYGTLPAGVDAPAIVARHTPWLD